MNSAVRLIFNESLCKKEVCESREQYTGSTRKLKCASLNKKKKNKTKQNADAEEIIRIQMYNYPSN